MIDGFHFAQTPNVIFGAGKIKTLPDLIKNYGSHVMIVTGGASFIATSHWTALQEQLTAQGVTWKHTVIKNEPTPSQIDEITQSYTEPFDAVVAIGGGSVLDAGKAISAMLGKSESVKNYLEGIGTQMHDGSKVPFIAVPTTSGTGSEATKNAVLSEVGEQGFKKSLRHDRFVPDVALIDPILTLNCPKALTAASGMDAFTQLLESYLSTKANIMTDSLAIKGLGCIRDSLKTAVDDGQNVEARTGMAYAAFASGLTLANAGLGTVHGMAGAIGGYFDIPHGAICGTLMSSINTITVDKLRLEDTQNIALQKYAAVGKLFSQLAHKSDDWHIDYLLRLMAKWTEIFEMPKFSTYGVTSSDFDRIIQSSANKNNPVAFSKEEMHQVLIERL